MNADQQRTEDLATVQAFMDRVPADGDDRTPVEYSRDHADEHAFNLEGSATNDEVLAMLRLAEAEPEPEPEPEPLTIYTVLYSDTEAESYVVCSYTDLDKAKAHVLAWTTELEHPEVGTLRIEDDGNAAWFTMLDDSCDEGIWIESNLLIGDAR